MDRHGRESCRGTAHGAPGGAVKANVDPRPTQSSEEIRSIIGHFKGLPDYRARIGSYPLWSFLAIAIMSHLCGAPSGQKDLEKFAAGLSDAQQRALGIRTLHSSPLGSEKADFPFVAQAARLVRVTNGKPTRSNCSPVVLRKTSMPWPGLNSTASPAASKADSISDSMSATLMTSIVCAPRAP